MIVECGHCGAPLDVREEFAITKCKYCGKANQRQHMRTIAATTPREFRPPPQWTPPPQFPQPSHRPLAYHAHTIPPNVMIAGIVMIALMGISAIYAVAGRVRGTSSSSRSNPTAFAGTTAPMLSAVDFRQTPEQIAKALSGRATDSTVTVTLADPRFNYLTISWDKQNPGHPVRFNFTKRPGAPDVSSIETALSKKLHGGLDKGNWRWYGGSSVHVHSGSISGNVDPKLAFKRLDNPRWEEKMVALWKTVLAAVFDVPFTISERDAWELLGAPQPFAKLALLNAGMDVDAVTQDVNAKLPGALAFASVHGLEVHVSVDHPLITDAEMVWKNSKNGHLEHATLRPPTTAVYTSGRKALVDCLKGKIGTPTVYESDHLNKKSDYSFLVGQTWIRVYETYVYITPKGFQSIPASDWVRIVQALDGCRDARPGL